MAFFLKSSLPHSHCKKLNVHLNKNKKQRSCPLFDVFELYQESGRLVHNGLRLPRLCIQKLKCFQALSDSAYVMAPALNQNCPANDSHMNGINTHVNAV